tara:strand:- start:14094 stop:15380 length:1287 start_codon:yes stop_codon:yes gene_type:complete
MSSIRNFKKLSFLVYGLGLTGKSVINFFIKNKINNYKVWDDKNKKLHKKKRAKNLNEALEKADYIILSPGVSLMKSKNKNKLIKYEKKIITDIDLIFLLKRKFKSIVVTGTNGKSTTCKIISHILKKNRFKVSLGGNIGTPILNLKIKKNSFVIIEASSFQLSHSKFIRPDFAVLLNITNDHLDWHGSRANYKNSKLKVFSIQKKNQFSLVNQKLKKIFQINKFRGKLIIPKIQNYKKLKLKIKNDYIKSAINDENMSHVFALSKILKINEKLLIEALNSFVGLPHRYEVFLKKSNTTFINDSKATSFEASKFALKNTKNIFWIVGGLPKKNDKIILRDLRKNIVKTYIIGKNINFFKSQIKYKVDFSTTRNLKNTIIKIIEDIKIFKREFNIILLSPSAASFDQFSNFERRGDEFKRLCKYYARKFI